MKNIFTLLLCCLSLACTAQTVFSGNQKKKIPFRLCNCDDGHLGYPVIKASARDANGYRNLDTLCIPLTRMYETQPDGTQKVIGYEMPNISDIYEYILPDGRSLGYGSLKAVPVTESDPDPITKSSPNFLSVAPADCMFRGKSMNARVMIVESSNADFNVKIVEQNEFLTVRYVTNSRMINDCGQWEIVTSGYDFTVRFVEQFEDFTIRIVD